MPSGPMQRPSAYRRPSPTAATTTGPTNFPKRSSRCSPPRPSTTSPFRSMPPRRTAGSGCTSTTTAGPSNWCCSTVRWARRTTLAAGSRPASRRSPTPSSTPRAGRRALKEIVPDRPSHDRRYLLDSIEDPRGPWAGSPPYRSSGDSPRPSGGTRPTGVGGSRCATGPRWSKGRGRAPMLHPDLPRSRDPAPAGAGDRRRRPTGPRSPRCPRRGRPRRRAGSTGTWGGRDTPPGGRGDVRGDVHRHRHAGHRRSDRGEGGRRRFPARHRPPRGRLHRSGRVRVRVRIPPSR